MLCLVHSAITALRQVAMLRGESTTTRAWLCSGNVSEPPEILQCSRESDMERQCTLGKSCKNRTLTHERTSHRWQDKAGFPVSGTSFLSFCLHIAFARGRLGAVKCGDGCFGYCSFVFNGPRAVARECGEAETAPLAPAQVLLR